MLLPLLALRRRAAFGCSKAGMLLLAPPQRGKVGGGPIWFDLSGQEHRLRASGGLQEAYLEEDMKLAAPRMTPLTLSPVHAPQDTFNKISAFGDGLT